MLLVTQEILDNTCRYKNSGKKVCFEIGVREKSMFFRQKLREKGPVLGKPQGKKFFILCRHPDILSNRKKRLIGNKQIFFFIIRLNQSESLSLYKR